LIVSADQAQRCLADYLFQIPDVSRATPMVLVVFWPDAMRSMIRHMKFTEIASRMTGFSSPLFGVSWQPPTADVAIVRRIIAFLEDRRVLYEPYEVEVPERCINSIMRMRDFLTDLLGEHAMGNDLEASVRSMRAACRKFMAAVDTRTRGALGKPIGIRDTEAATFAQLPPRVISMNDPEFNQALGELRGVFGIQVGMIATKYRLNVEDDLASILPIEDYVDE
jgi:hypothetical protein